MTPSSPAILRINTAGVSSATIRPWSRMATRVTQTLGFFHEMRGQQDGLPPGTHISHQAPNGVAGLWVQACGRFIQENQLRVKQERQGNEKALFLPTREFCKRRVALLLKA